MADGTRLGTLRPERAAELTPERIFAGLWDEYNRAWHGVNYGYTPLQLILNTRELRAGPWNYKPPIDPVSERDEQVAQAVIQWLGTKCGAVFLEEAERRIREKLARELVEYGARWNQPAGVVSADGGE